MPLIVPVGASNTSTKLTPIAKHTSSLAPSFYALSLLTARTRRLETDESTLARYEDCLHSGSQE